MALREDRLQEALHTQDIEDFKYCFADTQTYISIFFSTTALPFLINNYSIFIPQILQCITAHLQTYLQYPPQTFQALKSNKFIPNETKVLLIMKKI